jgi:serine/threonine protein kinase
MLSNLAGNCGGTSFPICNFGLSRVVQPARRHVVEHSPFTGVTRVLPRAANFAISSGQHTASLSSISVSIVDARGTMTKAAGTLQWMAPEVFRGDQDYGPAVDVYSFGMVLWELATRKTPWKDDIEDSEIETSLFNGINRALQTGKRPAVPDDVLAQHDAFVVVMKRCWAGDPINRPSFTEAARDLTAILDSQHAVLSSSS